MKFILIVAIICASLFNQKVSAQCSTCLNGGVAKSDGVGCVCPTGFQGDQCQYATNPCAAVDSTSCSNTDCYQSTASVFFSCQAKCLCCRNMKCYNGGRVVGAANGACTCQCFSVNGVSKYDSASNCQNVIAGQCTDDARCATQFGVFGVTTTNCKFDFVKYICPKTCGVCTA